MPRIANTKELPYIFLALFGIPNVRLGGRSLNQLLQSDGVLAAFRPIHEPQKFRGQAANA